MDNAALDVDYNQPSRARDEPQHRGEVLMSKKVCKYCDHFDADSNLSGFGTCVLMGDINKDELKPDRAYGWDYEGYIAGVNVGEQFGCIHWSKVS